MLFRLLNVFFFKKLSNKTRILSMFPWLMVPEIVEIELIDKFTQ